MDHRKFYALSIKRAGKAFECTHCADPIVKGESYTRISGPKGLGHNGSPIHNDCYTLIENGIEILGERKLKALPLVKVVEDKPSTWVEKLKRFLR